MYFRQTEGEKEIGGESEGEKRNEVGQKGRGEEGMR